MGLTFCLGNIANVLYGKKADRGVAMVLQGCDMGVTGLMGVRWWCDRDVTG